MDNTTLLILVVAVALAGVAIYFVRRHTLLKKRFGPEYERVVQAAGTVRAESELAARARRVGRYEIRPLTPDEGARFSLAWRQLQSRFVDDPAVAVSEADRLVTDLMAKRGYPMADFDRRAEDLSVDHPVVVSHYREAHQIVAKQQDPHRKTTTEELRQAVRHYRALFEDLLEIGETTSRRLA
jgi:hypothetical protein